MRRSRNSRKSKKNNNDKFVFLILVGFIVLMGFVISSQPNRAQGTSFCEKFKEFDNSTNNYPELKDQLRKMCEGGELSQEEEELGNLSMEFIDNLSFFETQWKENESRAKEYAEKIDHNYLRIMRINVNSSEIKNQVDILYRGEVGNVVAELEIQDMDIKNVNYSIRQLEEINSNLTARLENLRAEEENKNEIVKNLSLTYGQRRNESKNLESDLTSVKNENEKVIKSFIEDLFPFLLIGIALGGIIGVVLSLKWKKERIYWDAYSSSAKVNSPLKLVALLTGILIITLLLYLVLSGKLELILTG